MVLSRLDPSISYIEEAAVDPGDVSHDASMYAVDVDGIPLIIALGKQKNTHINKNVVYFPMYLVEEPDQIDTPQIGLFEVRYSGLPNMLDDDGDIDLERSGPPLLYGFVDKAFLSKASNETSRKIIDEVGRTGRDANEDIDEDTDADEDTDEDTESEDTESEDTESEEAGGEEAGGDEGREKDESSLADVFSVESNVAGTPLDEETAAGAKAAEKEFADDRRKPWVQRFMKNDNYGILKGKPGGDCIFEIVKDAFAQVGKITTVAALRKKIAEQVDQRLYAEYKEHYNMYADALRSDTKELKSLASHHNTLKKRLTETRSRSAQSETVLEARQVEDAFERARAAQAVSRSVLQEFQYMSRINSAAEFKEFIQTCDFWAETWALSTLERVLNIKFIMLSKGEYDAEDYYNVLECGELNDDILKKRGVFEPAFYIIVEHSGADYHLVSYKNKGILTFKELPYTLKEMLIAKCMERNESPYSIIPDFREMEDSLGLQRGGGPSGHDAAMPGDMGDLDCEVKITFVVSDTASPAAMPGRGPGEEVPIASLHDFAPLLSTPNWRQVLSPNYMEPVEIGGHNWPSVTHYYEGSKFRKEHPEFYLLFSADSGSDIAKDPGLARAIGSGRETYLGEPINTERVKIDRDFYGKKGRARKEMGKALTARSKQHKLFTKILRDTQRARLVRAERGVRPRLDRDLIDLRKTL